MLFTGQDEATATALAGNLFLQPSLTAADLTAPVANFQSQASQVGDWSSCCTVSAARPQLQPPGMTATKNRGERNQQRQPPSLAGAGLCNTVVFCQHAATLLPAIW